MLRICMNSHKFVYAPLPTASRNNALSCVPAITMLTPLTSTGPRSNQHPISNPATNPLHPISACVDSREEPRRTADHDVIRYGVDTGGEQSCFVCVIFFRPSVRITVGARSNNTIYTGNPHSHIDSIWLDWDVLISINQESLTSARVMFFLFRKS